MAARVYTFRITYANCDNRIWRIASVSSNYTLAKLGYLILASFDTMAYHLFDIRYKNTTFFLTEEDIDCLPWDGKETYDLLGRATLGSLGMRVGDVMEMTYDQGCCQVFEIALLKIEDMAKGRGAAYPKILDGAGRGIVDDMSDSDLLDAIRKQDSRGHSGIYYSSRGFDNVPEWDYKKYSVDLDNLLLRNTICEIQDGYEGDEDA